MRCRDAQVPITNTQRSPHPWEADTSRFHPLLDRSIQRTIDAFAEKQSRGFEPNFTYRRVAYVCQRPAWLLCDSPRRGGDNSIGFRGNTIVTNDTCASEKSRSCIFTDCWSFRSKKRLSSGLEDDRPRWNACKGNGYCAWSDRAAKLLFRRSLNSFSGLSNFPISRLLRHAGITSGLFFSRTHREFSLSSSSLLLLNKVDCYIFFRNPAREGFFKTNNKRKVKEARTFWSNLNSFHVNSRTNHSWIYVSSRH